ncbi:MULTISPECIES: diguanylate cyclase [unclassified Variovorax]|uniref:GGDEF domain-containing protein n=1 Tax=unclassified Variovorax TaxID=663243 RepID=UPI0025782D4C|nr:MULTISPECIES: diguanylate cyclase [unclassified Variovorax]MDM0085899.1 diguanylate cyclase [Variovorax sp. J22G40]MDM0145843.1 diguanylate cyclase [Variovorax sp. J2P1-31]
MAALGALWRRHPVFSALGCGVLVTGVMLALLSLTLWRERSDTLAHARQQADNLALIAQRDIERNFELYELSLQAIAENWGRPDIMSMPERLRNQVLFDRALDARHIASGAVIDASGRIAANLKNARIVGQDVGDRAYFRVHLDAADPGVKISGPFASRAVADMTNIALSRRISNADGSFAGVAVLYLNVDYFTELLQGLDIGAHGMTTVFGPEGTVITSLPAADAGHPSMYRRIQAAYGGSLLSEDASDRRARLLVFRTVADTGVKVLLAPALDDIYAPWRRRSGPVLAAMLVFGLGLIGLSGFLGRELQARARMERHLAVLANTDGLTGLANRRALESMLELEARRAEREGSELCVLFADVDHFKKFNDSQGHPEGDRVLAEVGRTMAHSALAFRGLVGRYGGEEFMVLVRQSVDGAALALAGEIQRAVEALGIPHPASTHGVVTVSIGIAAMGQVHPRTPSSLVEAADAALYRAKDRGRNRIHPFEAQAPA